MHNFLALAMEQFEMAVSYKSRVLRLLTRVKNIRNEDVNMAVIQALYDDISKEQKFIESQIKSSQEVDSEYAAVEPYTTARRIGWIELRDLLDFAFHLVSFCYLMCFLTLHQIEEKKNYFQDFYKHFLGLNDFELGQTISSGAFSTVYLSRRKDTNELCATKVMSKRFLRQQGMVERVKRECRLMDSTSRF